MKKNSWLYLIFVGLIISFQACQPQPRKVDANIIPGPNQRAEDMAKITFKNEVYDFGEILEGESVTYTFKFENTGKSDLVISNVSPDCGCTTAKNWSKKPYRPGERGEITVTFESEGRPGQANKNITVITNAYPSVVDLKLTGKVVGPEKK